MTEINPSGMKVTILTGEFAGSEGICLGMAPDSRGLWAVSPIASDEIVRLRFGKGFRLPRTREAKPRNG